MNWQSQDILAALDQCCEHFKFPMLDNGYVYAAATRLSLYRSAEDWAMVIEVFGFSPRSGIPDIHLYTFASRINRTKSEADFVTRQAYEAYMANNERNESTFIYPIEEGDWLDPENAELLGPGKRTVTVRDRPLITSSLQEYEAHDIVLQASPNVHVFEFCRLLTALDRNSVLATPDERRKCVPPELELIMQLEEWNHPDLANGERPGANSTFKSLAEVLATGDIALYSPSEASNTHWKNWPEGGSL